MPRITLNRTLKHLMAAIYAARIDPPPEGLPARYPNDIERLRHLCEVHRMDEHSVLRSVVREFLYDWNVILRPVAEPHLPLSNNAAEQALRHWVISRTISHGTRSEDGSPVPSLSSPPSSKPAAVAEHPPGSISAPSSPPLAKACSSPRSPPSRQPCRGVNDYVLRSIYIIHRDFSFPAQILRFNPCRPHGIEHSASMAVFSGILGRSTR